MAIATLHELSPLQAVPQCSITELSLQSTAMKEQLDQMVGAQSQIGVGGLATWTASMEAGLNRTADQQAPTIASLNTLYAKCESIINAIGAQLHTVVTSPGDRPSTRKTYNANLPSSMYASTFDIKEATWKRGERK